MDLISIFYWHGDLLSTGGQCTVGLNQPTQPIMLYMGEQV